MDFVAVIAAALAGFGFGAVWYMSLGRPWLAAADLEADPAAGGRPRRRDGLQPWPVSPFAVGLLAMVVVAGLLRHVFATAGIATPGAGLVAGAGIGAFAVLPFLAMNYAFGLRRPALLLIDGGNAVGACAAMGLVLTLL